MGSLCCTCCGTAPRLPCCPPRFALSQPELVTLRVTALLQVKREKMEVEIERTHAQVSGIMSTAGFDTLELSAQTTAAIAEIGHTHMTEVQARTIPPLLLGRDVLGAAKTGQSPRPPRRLLSLSIPRTQVCRSESER
jgi:hypothetical protein